MRKLILILATILCVGCVSTGQNLNVLEIESLRIGETTPTEAIQTFGPPASTVKSGDGNTHYIWHHRETGWLGPKTVDKTLIVIFDEKGKAVDYVRTSRENINGATYITTATKDGTTTQTKAESELLAKNTKECLEASRSISLHREQRREAWKECMRGRGYSGPEYAPAGAQQSVDESLTAYGYPKQLSNIAKLYNVAIKYDKKDQYTTTDEHRENIQKNLNKLLRPDGTIVVKVPSKSFFNADEKKIEYVINLTYFNNNGFGYDKARFYIKTNDMTKGTRG